ncbi:MAG: hypothetical protein CMF38_07430 [Legionellaceae bacterium]|nr:hypothetical protein [Legionellaceae bacterium]HAF88007.1 hypothetical protein [Legionellales bacterium]|tara:strand:+ start:66 stop:929 length:864 start_codon:yes stop_codon:yes gene_type:complete
MLKPLNDFRFIDVHYHANPDLYDRRHSAIAAGRLYQKYYGAVVLKSHLGSTAVQASIAQQEGYPVLPSLVLNDIAGGFEHRAIVRALLEYKPLIAARMLVHLPTITGRAYTSRLTRQLSHEQYKIISQQPLTVFNEHNQLRPAVKELFKIAANEPIVISTGHASKAETYALIEEIGKYPHSKLMLNQPANPLTGLDAKALLEISAQPNVFIEQTALTYLLGHQTKADFKAVLTSIPHVIYSSDLGQTSQIDVPEFITQSQHYFKLFGITKEREASIWRHNPIKMLKL